MDHMLNISEWNLKWKQTINNIQQKQIKEFLAMVYSAWKESHHE